MLQEKRVKELGGNFEDGYLNGELAVTRALGDRCMKSESPLIAEPEMTQMVLTKDDEFMIIGCDGIWDVMSNEDAVNLVRKQLMQHNDPQRCAAEHINQALRLHTSDNLTAIVVCYLPLRLASKSLGVQDVDSEKAHSRYTTMLQDNELMKGTKKLLWIEDGYLIDELAVKQASGCRRRAEHKQLHCECLKTTYLELLLIFVTIL
ncbi:probable protein phosphatase 2C 47 [Tanacetum coccineum]